MVYGAMKSASKQRLRRAYQRSIALIKLAKMRDTLGVSMKDRRHDQRKSWYHMSRGLSVDSALATWHMGLAYRWYPERYSV